MANALKTLGVNPGCTVATLAWNGYRHLELYYAVSGSGAVLHTLNPRLHPEQLAWIANHAEDEVLFFDLSFIALVEAAVDQLKCVRHFVVMCESASMPYSEKIPGLKCYEDLLSSESDHFEWPVLSEHSACSLCYTSGTTGNPKGVLYSHRSTILHAYAAALPDSLNCSAMDVILPVVPMFHVNAWGLPYIACMVGAKLVFPGPFLDGASLYSLFESEGVTLSAGVPTVWQGLLSHVESIQQTFSTMRRTIIGGAACSASMLNTFEKKHRVNVLHAWGMTELSPIGTVSQLKGHHKEASDSELQAVQCKQGRVPFGIDMKVVDPSGLELPMDGVSNGELLVRGHWVLSEYFKSGLETTLSDGWFPTGDVSNIDPDGYMQITDRTKDVIKSGGEWISSIDIENLAMSHPAVAMAACIGVKHPRWDERPLLIIVKKPGHDVSKAAVLSFFEGKIAKWWTPDDVVFVDAIPLGSTGKMLKHELRSQFGNHLMSAR